MLKWREAYKDQKIEICFVTEDPKDSTKKKSGSVECSLADYEAETAASEDGFVTISIDLSQDEGYAGKVTEFHIRMPQTKETEDIKAIWF